MRGVCDFTDFFVIATGRNARQTKAIYDEVSGVLKREHDLLPRAAAGAAEATWIVADVTRSTESPMAVVRSEGRPTLPRPTDPRRRRGRT